MIYRNLLFPLLKTMDAESVHERTLSALAFAQTTPPGRFTLRQIAGRLPQTPVTLFGLTFPNLIGIAAGFDKDVRVAAGLGMLGFGHIEVGTLTPRPQAGNPRPRVFRLPADGAIINRMGFPNGGVLAAMPRLARLMELKDRPVIGVSLGKQKETPLADAAHDYIYVMQQIYPYADYLAVNISSPNTPGLRELQGGQYLANLLQRLAEENHRLAAADKHSPKPMLVKIAPDLTESELDDILAALEQADVAGIIATNTTIARHNLKDAKQGEKGGLSGLPVRTASSEIIRQIHEKTAGRLPIIGVGGIRTADDVREKIAAGASLVQLYTGLIYEGPAMAGTILRQLSQ